VNIFHLLAESSATLDQAKLNQACQGVHDEFAQKLVPKLSTALIFETVECIQYLDSTDVLTSIVTAPVPGGDSGYLLPANVALVISWKIPAYYRGGHPRTYLAGIVSDRTNDNRTWTSQTISEFNTQANAFRLGMDAVAQQAWGPGSRMVTIQQFEKGGSTQVPKVYLDPPRVHGVVGESVHPRIDSQRRRLGSEF